MKSTPVAAAPPADTRRKEPLAGAPRKVFISYQRKDRKYALRLRRSLEAKKVTVWMDTGIQGGEDWPKKLTEGLNASKEVLLIVSRRSKASQWVQKEVLAALDRGMRVTPLMFRSCGKWDLIADLQKIDFISSYDEGFAKLMDLPPPPRTWWRWVRIVLNRIWDFRPYLTSLTLILGIVAYIYFWSDSKTSVRVETADGAALLVHVRNRGGRPSTLVGTSLRLDFGGLPIESEPLVPTPPAVAIRIPGHDDVPIPTRDDGFLTPKMVPNQKYRYSLAEIEPLLADAKITLRAQVKESDDKSHTLSYEFPGEHITAFIKEAFPDLPARKYE